MPERRPLLLGHRGARAVTSIPENTLESFDRALSDGCDGFEFDVRLTADGHAVVCHDPQSRGIEIASSTAAQLRHLPSLEKVLSRYRNRAFLDIELKVGGLEKITLELLGKYPSKHGFVVSSFLTEVLVALSSQQAPAPLGLLAENRTELGRWKELPVEYVIPHYKLATPSVVRQLKLANKKILVWTVNSPADMKRFGDLEVDGVISDKTNILCRTLSGRNS
jgi:glycerophosphoryl diester phosphodiesterase